MRETIQKLHSLNEEPNTAKPIYHLYKHWLPTWGHMTRMNRKWGLQRLQYPHQQRMAEDHGVFWGYSLSLNDGFSRKLQVWIGFGSMLSERMKDLFLWHKWSVQRTGEVETQSDKELIRNGKEGEQWMCNSCQIWMRSEHVSFGDKGGLWRTVLWPRHWR